MRVRLPIFLLLRPMDEGQQHPNFLIVNHQTQSTIAHNFWLAPYYANPNICLVPDELNDKQEYIGMAYLQPHNSFIFENTYAIYLEDDVIQLERYTPNTVPHDYLEKKKFYLYPPETHQWLRKTLRDHKDDLFVLPKASEVSYLNYIHQIFQAAHVKLQELNAKQDHQLSCVIS